MSDSSIPPPASSLDSRFALLGGKAVIKPAPMNRLQLVGAMRSGLPYAALTHLGRRMRLSVEDTAKTLGLSARTLLRRKGGRLDRHESESVFRLADVMARAIEVFGDEDGARAWLEEQNQALGGDRPLDLLDTEIGAETLRDLLGRIEYGVFS